MVKTERVDIRCERELKGRLLLQGYTLAEAFRIGAEILLDTNLHEEKEVLASLNKAKGEVRVFERKHQEFIVKREDKEREEEKVTLLKKNSCSSCGNEFVEGEKRFKIDGNDYCKGCFLAGNIKKKKVSPQTPFTKKKKKAVDGVCTFCDGEFADEEDKHSIREGVTICKGCFDETQ